MSNVEFCTNPDCGRPFSVSALGGGVPGGKEREPIDCPHCGHTVRSEMTSAVFRTHALSEEQERAAIEERKRARGE